MHLKMLEDTSIPILAKIKTGRHMSTVPFGFNVVAAYLILVLCLGLILSLIDFLQHKYRFTLKNIGILWTVYTVDWGLRISAYVLAIPLLLLLLVLQPIMVLAFLIAIVLLIIFLHGLFFEQPNISNPPGSEEALWAVLTVVGCLVIWLLAAKIFKSEDALYERYADFFVEKVHEPVQRRVQQLLQKMDR